MKIDQSKVNLQAQHEASSHREISFEYSDDFSRVLAESRAAPIDGPTGSRDDAQRHLLFLLQHLITLLFRIISNQSAEAPPSGTGCESVPPPDSAAPDAGRRMQWKSIQREWLIESENSQFSAQGTIRTADGQCLSFSLNVNQARFFSCESTLVQTGSVVLRDPLILNLSTQGVELSGGRFVFDLDADGISEAIPELAGGSVFLALDRNGDGRIADGQELFGTRSGNGFADLATLDDDGNGWIDAADRAYAQLCLWSGSEDPAQLRTLTQEGIGALSLAHIDTPFSLTDEQNRHLGQVRHSGVYLREDGRVGSMQQVDLAV